MNTQIMLQPFNHTQAHNSTISPLATQIAFFSAPTRHTQTNYDMQLLHADDAQLDFQAKLNAIAAANEARAQNLGYGLGRALGLLLGTVKEEDDEPDTALVEFKIPEIESAFSELHIEETQEEALERSSMRSNAENYPKPEKVSLSVLQYITRPISAIFNFFWPSEKKPKIVEFVASSDPNGAFKDGRLAFVHNDAALNQAGYSIERFRIEDADRICEILPEHYKGEKLGAILFSGHGERNAVHFGDMSITRRSRLTRTNLASVLHCLPDYLSTNAKIVYSACSTGDFSVLPLKTENADEDHLFSWSEIISQVFSSKDNLALATYRFMRATHPDVVVVAPGDVSFGTYIESLEPLIVHAPSGKVEEGFYDSTVIYDKRSVELIEKAKSAIQNKPWIGVFNTGILKTKSQQDSKEAWEQSFESIQQELADALGYTPTDKHSLVPGWQYFFKISGKIAEYRASNINPCSLTVIAAVGSAALFFVYKKRTEHINAPAKETEQRSKLSM